MEYLPRPSIKAEQEMVQNMVFDIDIDLRVIWMDQIIHYLKDGRLLEDMSEAHRIKTQASRYWLSPNQKLYRRSYSGPYLRCVHLKKVQSILFELHEDNCGSHTRGRSLTF